MRKTIYVQWACYALIVIALVGCRKDRPDGLPDSDIPSDGRGEVVTLDIQGGLDLEMKDVNGTRYTLIGRSGKNKGPQISLLKEKDSPKPLILFLAREDAPMDSYTIVKIDPSRVKINRKKIGGENKYTISYKGEVRLNTGYSFSSGKWYVSGVYGHDATKDGKKWELAPFALGEYSKDVDLPLQLPWTRLSTKNEPLSGENMQGEDPKLARNRSLSFKPAGVFLRVRVLNNLVEPAVFRALHMVTAEFEPIATHGYSRISRQLTVQELKNEGLPITGKRNTAALNNSRYLILPGESTTSSRFLGSGVPYGKSAEGAKDIYFWVLPTRGVGMPEKRTKFFLSFEGYPTPPTPASHNQNYGVDTQLAWNLETRPSMVVNSGAIAPDTHRPFTNSDIKNEGRRESPGPRPVVQITLSRDENFQAMPKRSSGYYKQGVVYPTNVLLTSDLMITEVYIDRGGVERISPTPSGNITPCYGLVEIYNPTLSDIPLDEYGITRLYHHDYTVGTSSMSTITSRFCPVGTHTTPTSADNELLVKAHGHALVLPLGGGCGTWQTANKKFFGFRTANEAPEGSNKMYIGLADGVPSLDNYPEHPTQRQCYDLSGALGCEPYHENLSSGASRPILKAGKTMIILSSSYLHALRQGTLTHSQVGNELDRMSGEIPLIFSKIRDAIRKGYCQYVIAMNNDMDGLTSAGSNPGGNRAGVMTMGVADNFALVRKRAASPHNRILVDAFWTYDMWRSPSIDDIPFTNSLSSTIFSNHRGFVRKRRGPLVANTGFLVHRDMLNRVPYTPGMENLGSNFGVVIDAEYSGGWGSYFERVEHGIDVKKKFLLK